MLGESRIVDHFVEQAGWNKGLGSPFTAAQLLRFAEDYKAEGPVYALCADWAGNPRKDALGLRLAGALHHAVLTSAAPELAAVYPSQSPDWDMDRVWPIARDWLSANIDPVRAFMQSPPQTNETRRSIALLPGFLKIAAAFNQPLHLLELGASAGLNQNWDRYAYHTHAWSRPGSSEVTIKTEWNGPAPEHLDIRPVIASRAACDLNPIDLSDPEQVFRLKCYTWADQKERLDRLDAAIRLTQETGVRVERADAAEWLEEKLAARPSSGVTVVYHSVFLIYPPREVIARIMDLIRQAGAAATTEAPLAWLSYESEALFGGDRISPNMHTRLETWPGGTAGTLLESDGHITQVQALVS